jgi:hypothetical protein
VQNKIQQIINNIKKANKRRTISLSIFLILLITLPLILKSPQEKQNIQQPAHAQIVPNGVFPIFGTYATNLDTLRPNWTAKITFGAVTSAYDMHNKAPVYCGTNSISWTITSSAYEQLELISPAAFDISPYAYLTFYAQAGSPGQNIGAVLIGTDGKSLPAPATVAPINQYGGAPIVGSWTEYNIPISAFNTTNKTILGIALKDLNGGTQNIQPPPPIYFDEINFSTQKGAAIPCPTGGAAQITIPAPTQGIEMPYYPNISPWVFIIPAIIIGLAIVFQ